MAKPTRRGALRSVRAIVESSLDDMEVIGSRTVPMPNGCLAYKGDLTKYHQYKRTAVHRYVWEAMHGPIDLSGFHIHHKCENPGCINPYHLVALTPLEHMRAHDAMNEERQPV